MKIFDNGSKNKHTNIFILGSLNTISDKATVTKIIELNTFSLEILFFPKEYNKTRPVKIYI